jgi:hypothetical protein
MGVVRSLSTGSPPSFAGNVSGSIYGVNGIDRPFVRDPVNGFRNWGIDAPPAAPATALGAATGPTGTYIYKVTWENQNAGIYGLYSDASTPLVVTNDKITVTRPSISGIDAQVTHWVVWRNTDGQSTTFYRVASVAIGTATYTDDASDDAVSSNETLEEHSPPSGLFRYVKEFKGLLFLFGSVVESTGTVTVANGSGSVTGTGTQFSDEHVGQKLYFTGDSAVYTISAVASATGLTITPVKSGAVTGGTYKILAERPSDMAVQRGDDESFRATDRWGVFPNDGDFPTGMDVVGNTLCLYKKHHVYGYEFGADPLPSASAVVWPILKGRGLVNEWCSVNLGPTAFNLDAVGIYQFDGAGQAVPIDQAIRRFFHPDPGVEVDDRINWSYTDTWRAVYDPATHAAKFFVTTGTDAYPKTALVFDIERERWTVDRFPAGVRAAALGADSSGNYRAWVTDNLSAPYGPWALSGTRQLDGTSQGTIAGNATASGNTSLTDSGASFRTTGGALAGIPVTAFTTPPQTRIISSNTGTVLTIASAWDSNPAVGTAYRVGAVETRWKSMWHAFDPQSRIQAQRLTLFFQPTATKIPFYVRLFKDYESSPILAWEPRAWENGLLVPMSARTDGWVKVSSDEGGGRVVLQMPQNAKRAFAVEIMQFDANNPVIITGYDLDGDVHGRDGRAD